MPYSVGENVLYRGNEFGKVINVYSGGAYYEVEISNEVIVSCTEKELSSK